MNSFKGKSNPESWEQTASKLMDDRWLDVLMWKIKNRDAYLESRKRLGTGKKDWQTHQDRDKEPVKPNNRKKGGGKGDRKGEDKGSQHKGAESFQGQNQG
jgi:hypothetical protein